MSRRISRKAVMRLAAALMLTRELQLPVGKAIRIAGELQLEASSGRVRTGVFCELQLDLGALRTWVDQRLRLAAEVVPPSRRGRPAGRRAYS